MSLPTGTEVVRLDAATRAAVVEVVRSNDHLRARIARVVDLSMDTIEEALHTGSMQARLAIASKIVPSAMRELQEEKVDTGLEELREEVASLHQTFRDQIGSGDVTDVESWEEVLVVDTPPPSNGAGAQ